MWNHAASDLRVGRGSQLFRAAVVRLRKMLRPTSGSGEDRNPEDAAAARALQRSCVRPPGRARIATSGTGRRRPARRSCVRPPGRARIATTDTRSACTARPRAASDLRVGRGSQLDGAAVGAGEQEAASDLRVGRGSQHRAFEDPPVEGGERCVRPPGRARIATRAGRPQNHPGRGLRPTSGSGEDRNLRPGHHPHCLPPALRPTSGSGEDRNDEGKHPARPGRQVAASDLRVGRGSQLRVGGVRLRSLRQLRPTSGSGEDRNTQTVRQIIRGLTCCVRPPGRARIATSTAKPIRRHRSRAASDLRVGRGSQPIQVRRL